MQFRQSFIEVLKEILTNLTQYMQSKNNMTACEYSKSDNVKANSSCCLALQDSLQWSLYDSSSASFSAWLIFHLASLLDSTKIARSPITTEKHEQHKPTFQ